MFRILAPAALLIAGPALADGIVPKDGTWITDTESGSFSDSCPEIVTPFLQPMLNAMQDQSGQEQELEFGGDFDPERMSPEQTGEVTWEQVSEDEWVGSIAAEGQDIGTVTVEVRSEEEIASGVVLNIGALMGEQAGALGVTAEQMAACTMNMDMVSTHSG